MAAVLGAKNAEVKRRQTEFAAASVYSSRKPLARTNAVHGRIEEQIEVIVRERLASQLGDARQPAAVGEKHQEHRRIRDPRHVRDQRGDGALLVLVAALTSSGHVVSFVRCVDSVSREFESSLWFDAL